MPDYYLEGEERFGPIMSRLYSFFRCTGRAKALYRFISSDLEASGASRILDVGTGTGTVPIMLAKSNPGLKLYAVDPSESMIKIAKSSSRGLKNAKFGLGSSRSILFGGKFDIIFTSLSFHHWKDKEGSLRYLATRLSKGGEIRVYEFDRGKANPFFKALSSHMSTISEIAESGRKAGLKLSSSKESGGIIRATLKRKN
ncbi:MAG: class I SAM-dependent methyltransferase [Candidatus Micrarchaeota archaeon]|nr:class I SAM-dependent methyltransferase [Candidatus Micrarchaeota archaeon]